VRRSAAGIVVAVTLAGCGADGPDRADVRRASSHCPEKLLPLGANPLPAASRAALRRESRKADAQITAAYVASGGLGRAAHVRHACGREVAARSVVVEIHRRAHDRGRNKSASLAQGTVVAGRFAGGWRVWDVLH
jgi:hypothetical protein